MNKAVEFAADILRMEQVQHHTKSKLLKRDYTKGCAKKRSELRYYCKCNHFSIKEVFEEAQHWRQEMK